MTADDTLVRPSISDELAVIALVEHAKVPEGAVSWNITIATTCLVPICCFVCLAETLAPGGRRAARAPEAQRERDRTMFPRCADRAYPLFPQETSRSERSASPSWMFVDEGIPVRPILETPQPNCPRRRFRETDPPAKAAAFRSAARHSRIEGVGSRWRFIDQMITIERKMLSTPRTATSSVTAVGPQPGHAGSLRRPNVSLKSYRPSRGCARGSLRALLEVEVRERVPFT